MIRFNDGWLFAKGKPENFTPVELPHDWLISDTGNLYESGIGWYRRELDASFLEKGQRLFLRFDGVYMDSALYVNDRKVGEWKYGCTAFYFDITAFTRTDCINTLLVKVDYKAPSARWYTGAGIYRDVSLSVKNECHFVPDGIYVTTAKKEGRWSFEVEAEAETGGKPYELRHTLLGAEGGIKDWDVDDPRLYTVRSELLVNGVVTDSEDTRIGFRTVEYTADRGFFLNGRRVKLNGMCLHQDLGPLGAAVHPDAIRRQLTLIKAMGVNALRTAHNPPAKVFMDIADEMGFLVMSELLDVWKNPKNAHDYARFFDEWIEKDAAAWIRRDRNHPSVILWSVGNEISDTNTDPEDGAKTLRRLMGLVRQHDPKGHAPATFCSNYLPWENTQKCADIVKIVGYNYGEHLYERHHAEHPDWVIYGSETCSTAQSRGVYHFPLARSILADDDLQCSALGNSSTSWGSKSAEACICADRDTPFSLGQFVWAAQDYIGEPTPYHTKSSYLGHIDTAGFPKDSYYLFQASWTDWRTAPMVHLFPYWDFSDGELIDVRACSNAPGVELFFDGESLGTVTLEATSCAERPGTALPEGKAPGRKYIADWRIPYRKGTLRAVARDGAGKEIAAECRKPFGDAATIDLRRETFGELMFVTISALDRDGNPVENANRRVRVSVENGTLLGLDNGDATDYEQYASGSRRLFGGKLLAIVKLRNGEIPRIAAAFDTDDIPVRKIGLEKKGYTVTARIFPPDATYGDLEWRLTDAGGIDSPLGSLAVAGDGRSVTVRPKGDGDVCVRCGARNGRDHPSLISQRTLAIAGMGKPFLDPYGFVSAGLYNCSNAELTNGNERGVATLRDGESQIGFKDLDFGDYGSDLLTLQLFPLSPDPFAFEIWEGMPKEGGTLLCAAPYDRGSIWNTYMEVTYELPRRLRGVTTLCLVFRQKVHVKGFIFKKYRKAFRKLSAAEYDGISGDSFVVKSDAVENIGNNVSIVFGNMDFGAAGAGRVALRWRSKLAKNSIQCIFADEAEKIQKMIVVDRADDWTSGVFPLDGRITGAKTVTLSFLPGCSLDLAWFQFLE